MNVQVGTLCWPGHSSLDPTRKDAICGVWVADPGQSARVFHEDAVLAAGVDAGPRDRNVNGSARFKGTNLAMRAHEFPIKRSRPHVPSTEGRSIEGAVPQSFYEVVSQHLARLILLATLIYASWHYGAADVSALRHLTIPLSIALLLLLTCKRTYRVGANSLPVIFFALILAWVGYAGLQASTIGRWIPGRWGEVSEVQRRWAAAPIAMLAEANENLQPSATVAKLQPVSNVNAEETRQALVPFLLAGASAILSALLFQTPATRMVFLWTVIGNAAALSFWGIIQKASRPSQILPGIENIYSSSVPFSSFIYKNAGAAALLPALAAVAALIYCHSSSGRRQGGPSREAWGNRTKLLETRNLVLLSLAVLLFAGLAASLSRGAWFAAICATLVAGPLCGITIRRRDHLIVAVIAVLGITCLITFTGIRQEIQGRAEAVSLDSVSRDSRWPQWVDGFTTALAHLPNGSGLGTYGYATLPHLSSARGTWFAEAHNQYLEVLTESGLVGITLLFSGMAWLAIVSWRLKSRRHDRERRSWGILGVALLVCGGVQSIFDFVLVIPANLILYASLIGVIGAISQHRKHRGDQFRFRSANRIVNSISAWLVRGSKLSAVWCAIALMFVLAAYAMITREQLSRKTLAKLGVEEIESRPDSATLDAALDQLTSAIDRHPTNARLRLRRANWHLIAYRCEVFKSAEREGVSIAWADTSPENLFALLNTQRNRDRESLLAGLRRTPQMRESLTSAASDLSSTLSLAPLSPRGHLTGAVISPLLGMPTTPWLESTATLVNNSPEMLFLNGLFALQSGEVDIAIDQWKGSIAISDRYLVSIFDLSRKELPLMQVATNLVPPDRPDLYVRLLTSHRREQSARSKRRPSPDEGPIEAELMRHVRANDRIAPGPRHATVAMIQRMMGNDDAELKCWEAALREQARDPNFRLEYSQSLSRVGRNDEALKQAILGKTLNPSDDRFERLATRIRRQIRTSSR